MGFGFSEGSEIVKIEDSKSGMLAGRAEAGGRGSYKSTGTKFSPARGAPSEPSV